MGIKGEIYLVNQINMLQILVRSPKMFDKSVYLTIQFNYYSNSIRFVLESDKNTIKLGVVIFRQYQPLEIELDTS